MVDIALIPPPPPSFLTPPFPPNLAYPTCSEPLPSVEGCGLLQHGLSSLRTEELGREKDEGGTMKWEAQLSYETQATTFVVVHFRQPSSPHL